MTRTSGVWPVLTLFLLLLATTTMADPPRLIRYEAILTDAAGVPLTGLHEVKFDIYDQETGGVLQWTDTWNRDISSGVVDVMLGGADPPNPIPAGLFTSADRWVEVTITPSGEYASLLSPRQRLVSVPYSLAAERLGTMTLVDVQADADTRIATHALLPSAHHVKTTDASELTLGTLDNARLSMGPGGGIDADTLDGIDSTAICLGAACGKTPQQIAMLRWYEGSNLTNTFDVEASPIRGVFDGFSIWIANSGDDSLTKLQASDGQVLSPAGGYPVGDLPRSIVFDGKFLWVTHELDNNVYKVRASDGGVEETCDIGETTFGAAFDGTSIWVASFDNNTVMKITPSTPCVVSSPITVGTDPHQLAFDGANIWVTNSGSNNVSRIRVSDDAVLSAVDVGSIPQAIAFDGEHMWVGNSGGPGTVSKVRAADQAIVGTYDVGSTPLGIAFDGASIWVANQGTHDVTKLRATDGAPLGTFPTGGLAPRGVVFDGASIWVMNINSANVTKL